MISKFGDWWLSWYKLSDHPENVAIRNIISRNREHNFILLGEGSTFHHDKADGIHFYNLAIDSVFRSFFSFILKFGLVITLRPSVIASFGTVNLVPLGISSILTSSRFIPIIAGEVTYAVENMPKNLRKVTKFLLKAVFLKAYKILVLAESIKKDLMENYNVSSEKLFVYRYGISEIFNPNVEKTYKSVLNPSGPVVLSICRISPEKGIDYLIKASRIFVEKLPSVKIVIIGSAGENAALSEKRYYEKLTHLIHKYNLQQHVSILKYTPHSEIPKYFSASDVFVLPSLSEGLPNVLLEALASGIPIVATSVGGVPDILTNEKNSLLVKPRDVESLAEAILKILNEKNFRKEIIRNGLESASLFKKSDMETFLSSFIFET